ncbi:MAG: hypothetical protein MJ250_09205 [Alphaproteobacteria bacterium]|nr:hypothetical protein [Alphaproteobacteria bacterium]
MFGLGEIFYKIAGLSSQNPYGDTRYDRVLKKSEQLTWLPWIGHKFVNSKHRVLIVAESHYAKGTSDDEVAKDIERIKNNADYSRACVYESQICNDWNTNMFRNLNLALLGGKQPAENISKMWQKLAYFNVVQRPMYTRGERPCEEDFKKGYFAFHDVVKAIQPTRIVFVGVSAAKYFDNTMGLLKCRYTPIVQLPEGQGAWARESSIDGIPIYFIRHSSECFSWNFWHDFLKNHCSAEMEFLKNF